MLSMVKRMLPSGSFDAIRQFARLSKDVSLEHKILWNVFSHSAYGYGLLHACIQARKLGIEEVSALELGVAGGNGLVALERFAQLVEKATDVKVRTFGFDTGSGLPPPADYRDMPYFFRGEDFGMDVQRLRARLQGTELILGDVVETIPRFLERHGLPPIAFIGFDLDYYHPTRAVLDALAKCPDELTLPRPFLYFDNTVGLPDTLYNEFTGELLAIDEFNRAEPDMKIARDRSLDRHAVRFLWYQKMYVLHRFTHETYTRYIGSPSSGKLALTR